MPPSDQELNAHVRPLYLCRGAETFKAYPSHETNVFGARNVSPLTVSLKFFGWVSKPTSTVFGRRSRTTALERPYESVAVS